MSRFNKFNGDEKPKSKKFCLRSSYLTALHFIAIMAVAGNYFYITDSYGIVKMTELDAYRQQVEQENAALKKQISNEDKQYTLQLAQAGKEAKQEVYKKPIKKTH